MKEQEILYYNVSQLLLSHDISTHEMSKNLTNISYDMVRKWFSRKRIPLTYVTQLIAYLSKSLNRKITKEELLCDADFVEITVKLTKEDFEKLKKITHNKDTLHKRLNRLISLSINENYIK